MIFSGLPRTVVILGLVSLMNDMASDMIAPLLPIFLTAALGAGPAVVGLIEGVAETTASLLKLWSGRLVDRGASQKKLAVGGYLLSNAIRPTLGAVGSWGAVLLIRFTDRVGKGLRTAPRDALISASVDEGARGRAFGLHRSMDHAGAMIGPIAASALLAVGFGVNEVFYFSVIPGMAAVALLAFGVNEPSYTAPAIPSMPPPKWSDMDGRMRAMILSAGGLAFSAVPDAFFALWLSVSGVPLAWIPVAWTAAHLVKSAVAMPAGKLSDSAGRVPVALFSWTARAVVAAIMPWFGGAWMATLFFLLYAGASAGSEGAERALIGDKAGESSRGSAFGMYHMVAGLLALPGAALFGAVWQVFGAQAAFMMSSAVTLVSALLMRRETRG
jgi:MFS family permease